MNADEDRASLASIVLNYVSNHPLGCGFFHQFDVVQGLTGHYYSHNIVLEIMMQGGYVLLIIFALFLIRLYKKYKMLVVSDSVFLMLTPIATFTFVMLLFSGSYIQHTGFWFLVLCVLMKRKVHSRTIV